MLVGQLVMLAEIIGGDNTCLLLLTIRQNAADVLISALSGIKSFFFRVIR